MLKKAGKRLMKIKMASDELFVKSLQEAEYLLNRIGFIQSHFERQGYAVFVDFNKQTTTVTFMFGPPEWHVEMIILTPKQRYAFKDVLQMPIIAEWVNENNFSQEDENYIKSEILWFIKLLKFALPFLEQD